MEWFVFAIIAAFLFGLVGIIEKKVLINEHALEVSTITALFIFLLSIFFINKVQIIPLRLLLIIYVVSLLGTFAFWYVMKGIRHLEVSSAVPLLTFGPVITAFLAFLFLGEKLSGINISGIALIVIGSYILEVDHKLYDLAEPLRKILKSRYIHYILLSLLLWSIAALLDRFVLGGGTFNINIFTYFFFINLFIAINFLILITVLHKGIKSIKHGLQSAGKYLFLLAIVLTLTRLSFYKAVSVGLIGLVYAVFRSGTLFSTIVGGELFHEKRLVLKIIATVIMVIGVYLITI